MSQNPSKLHIRFYHGRESTIWIEPADVLFIKSADHYVKTLVLHEREKKWMMRHCTLKDILSLLETNHFIRLNKFYVINKNHLSHIDEMEKKIYLNDGFPIPISHRVSRYLINTLKS